MQYLSVAGMLSRSVIMAFLTVRNALKTQADSDCKEAGIR